MLSSPFTNIKIINGGDGKVKITSSIGSVLGLAIVFPA
jgi:hypothetical protein